MGKPGIAHLIETALKSGQFDEVMVSAEDEEIAEIAKKYGAKVLFMRSCKNADDNAAVLDMLKEVLQEYGKLNHVFDWVEPMKKVCKCIKF